MNCIQKIIVLCVTSASLYGMDTYSILSSDESIFIEKAAFFIVHGKKHCWRYALPKSKQVTAEKCHAHDELVNHVLCQYRPVAMFYNQDGQKIGEYHTIPDKKKLYKWAQQKLDPNVKPRAITAKIDPGSFFTLTAYDKDGYRLIKILKSSTPLSNANSVWLTEDDKEALLPFVDISQLGSITCKGIQYRIDQDKNKEEKK